MKLESTNISIIANEAMSIVSIGQNGKTPAFIEYKHLEELRDLLNNYFEMQYGQKPKRETK